jgi:hypothetical protein
MGGPYNYIVNIVVVKQLGHVKVAQLHIKHLSHYVIMPKIQVVGTITTLNLYNK